MNRINLNNISKQYTIIINIQFIYLLNNYLFISIQYFSICIEYILNNKYIGITV